MMKNGFGDALKVMTGKDLEDDAPRIKKTGKKTKKVDKAQEPKQEPKARKDVATDDAKFKAYDYANEKDQLSNDVKTALKEGSLSDELIRLLEVLFDKKAVRDLVAAQGDVCPPPPGPNEYYLDFRFVNPDNGDWVNEQAEALMKAGTNVDGLKAFNIELRVVRKRKLDDTEIQEGTDEDYEEIRQKLDSANVA